MRNLIRLTDYTAEDIYDIFKIADKILEGAYADYFRQRLLIKKKI